MEEEERGRVDRQEEGIKGEEERRVAEMGKSWETETRPLRRESPEDGRVLGGRLSRRRLLVPRPWNGSS